MIIIDKPANFYIGKLLFEEYINDTYLILSLIKSSNNPTAQLLTLRIKDCKKITIYLPSNHFISESYSSPNIWYKLL